MSELQSETRDQTGHRFLGVYPYLFVCLAVCLSVCPFVCSHIPHVLSKILILLRCCIYNFCPPFLALLRFPTVNCIASLSVPPRLLPSPLALSVCTVCLSFHSDRVKLTRLHTRPPSFSLSVVCLLVHSQNSFQCLCLSLSVSHSVLFAMAGSCDLQRKRFSFPMSFCFVSFHFVCFCLLPFDSSFSRLLLCVVAHTLRCYQSI